VSAVSDETGSGALVFAASPTLTGTVSAEMATLSGNLTLSGGTANGVAYLNGSKVLTTGSALTFNGTALTSTAGGLIITNVNSSLSTTAINFGSLSGGTYINTPAANIGYLAVGGTGAYSWFSTFHTWAISGSEQMRLTSTGLGIGTSSPGAKLDVVGAIRLRTAGAEFLYASDGGTVKSGFLLDAGNAKTDFYTNGTLKATLDSSGNLGLGVTPSAWESTVKAIQFGSLGYVARGSSGQTMLGYNNYVNTSNQFIYSSTTQASRYEQFAGEHRWLTAPSGTAGNAISFTQAMTLDASGNLLVGTTTADSARLTVMGSSGGIILDDGNGRKLKFDPPGSINSNTAFIGTTTPHPLRINSGTSTNEGTLIFSTENTERARITSGGIVLIGTTSASGGLAAGGLEVSDRIAVNTGSVGTPALHCTTDTNTGIYYPAADTIGFSTNGTERMRIDSSGNLGIGTSSPSYKLTLNGQPGANGYTAWTNYSDARLKENIVDFAAESVLDKVCALRPVTFNYNDKTGFDEATRQRRISGFIAQELQEVFPDMVGTVDVNGDEYLDTNLSNLTLYLLQAVKEQQAIINQLKARLDAANL